MSPRRPFPPAARPGRLRARHPRRLRGAHGPYNRVMISDSSVGPGATAIINIAIASRGMLPLADYSRDRRNPSGYDLACGPGRRDELASRRIS